MWQIESLKIKVCKKEQRNKNLPFRCFNPSFLYSSSKLGNAIAYIHLAEITKVIFAHKI